MITATLTIPVGIARRIEKLAQEAGRTPTQTLKFVIRDGLEHAEHAVREANAGLQELEAGKGSSLEAVKERVAARRKQRMWPSFISDGIVDCGACLTRRRSRPSRKTSGLPRARSC